jgi:cell wall-associated NlpC family hydrolase
MRRCLPLTICLCALAVSGCASTGATPQPFPRPAEASVRAPEPDSADAAAPSANVLVGTALSLRGAPYRDGGNTPSGFDCSGFVEYVFGQQGQFMPRTVSEQFLVGAEVGRRGVEPGDLVFLSTTSTGPSHVGIAISASEFVHAPSSSGVVRVESLRAPYWASRFLGARRLP